MSAVREAVEDTVKYPEHWLKPRAKPRQRSKSRTGTTHSRLAFRHKISKSDKTIFCLRERQLCALTSRYAPLGSHFLELSSDDQQILREMLQLQVQFDMHLSRAAEGPTEAPKGEPPGQLRRAEALEQSGEKQRQRSQAILYANMLPNLIFDDKALKRLELLAFTGNSLQVIKKLYLINLGQVNPEDTIKRTEPRVLNYHAGYDYRIYAIRHGTRPILDRSVTRALR
jgi:hypothetical protein